MGRRKANLSQGIQQCDYVYVRTGTTMFCGLEIGHDGPHKDAHDSTIPPRAWYRDSAALQKATSYVR